MTTNLKPSPSGVAISIAGGFGIAHAEKDFASGGPRGNFDLTPEEWAELRAACPEGTFDQLRDELGTLAEAAYIEYLDALDNE